jgi:c-di-GMP-related signal transduction protein
MTHRFMARQPTFDCRIKVFAYELLSRSGPDNFFTPGPAPADDVIVNATMLLDKAPRVRQGLRRLC